MRQLDHLHLVELVAALDSPHVPARAHLLAPPAWRVGNVLARKVLGFQNLLTVKVRNRNLCGGNPPEVLFMVTIQVVAELRQLPGADEAVLAHDEWRINLLVAVLADMYVQEPRDQRAL